MKKLIVIIGASCLLVGCGSQNLDHWKIRQPN